MSPKPISDNTLFYGDNLKILREYIPDESVDLIYLDPPFNSNRSYNVLFKDESGREAESQIMAFDDTGRCRSSAATARSTPGCTASRSIRRRRRSAKSSATRSSPRQRSRCATRTTKLPVAQPN